MSMNSLVKKPPVRLGEDSRFIAGWDQILWDFRSRIHAVRAEDSRPNISEAKSRQRLSFRLWSIDVFKDIFIVRGGSDGVLRQASMTTANGSIEPRVDNYVQSPNCRGLGPSLFPMTKMGPETLTLLEVQHKGAKPLRFLVNMSKLRALSALFREHFRPRGSSPPLFVVPEAGSSRGDGRRHSLSLFFSLVSNSSVDFSSPGDLLDVLMISEEWQ
jgi:hypothetical protein